MRVENLVPDVAPPRGPGATTGANGTFGAPGNAFGALVDAAGALLDRADVAETRFAAHKGGLQEMVVERARADIALQVAAAAAQRTAQSLQTLLGMQL
ncbi:MAG: hypothetical protein QOI11_2797 [Candidatus Eremiobacteraeota bacterium]|jgi:flagellar hook-basal body complex protein FliE|nr:hypothetical protein [Candidatus Eremiobacteraeota bacterium]